MARRAGPGWTSLRRGTRWVIAVAGIVTTSAIGALVTLAVENAFGPDETPATAPAETTVRSLDASGGAPWPLAIAGPVRRVFWCRKPDACYGPPHPAMNAFVNAPNYGDERAFLDVKDATVTAAGSYANQLQVHHGQVLVVRAYYANSAQPGPSARTTARGVRLRITLPRRSRRGELVPAAYLSGENTRPRVIYDRIRLYGERPFTIAYIPGSATRTTRAENEAGWTTSRFADAVIGHGARLGDIGWDFAMGGMVTIKVKVSMPVDGPISATRAVQRFPQGTDWGAGPSRPAFRCTRNGWCPGPPYVTLNSFWNDPVLGNEWRFMRGQRSNWSASTGVERYTSTVSVRPGDDVSVTMQVANNFDRAAAVDTGLTAVNSVARAVRGLVILPYGRARELGIVGWLHARNARPRMISSVLALRSSHPIRVRPVKRSAFVQFPPDAQRAVRDYVLPDNGLFASSRDGSRVLVRFQRGAHGVGVSLERPHGRYDLPPGREHAIVVHFRLRVVRG